MTSAPGGTVIAVFARLDSKRLPGKALTSLAGRPLLGRVLDRVRAAAGPGETVVLATSERAVDDPIAAFGAAEGVAVFRGDGEDVAARCLACADAFGAARIVRISGDSPFIDGALLRAVIARGGEAAPDLATPDLATNVFPRTFPPGVSVESIAAAALRRMLAETDDREDREHVTRYLYANPGRFRIANVAAPDGRYAGVTLTVDTPEDLAKAEWIVARLGDAAGTADLDTIAALAREYTATARPAAAEHA